jgi:formamidopyrimidine-DNA glycosylase
MPELPEIETLRRELHPELIGRRITDVSVRWARSVDRPGRVEFRRRLVGRRINEVQRRGKYLVVDLDDGQSLLVHLKMSGQLFLRPMKAQADPYTRVVLTLDDGRELRFCDARKFGRLYLVNDAAEVTGALGPEPLDETFTVDVLAERLAQRRVRLKPLLLDQTFLAGLGNIYANEVLHRARLHPLRRTDSLSRAEVRRLHWAIRDVLRRAIADAGASIDVWYRRTDGSPGNAQERFRVYGRAGEPCPRCGTPIQRIMVSGRGTHICPQCQR